jgi:hypothetical protein
MWRTLLSENASTSGCQKGHCRGWRELDCYRLAASVHFKKGIVVDGLTKLGGGLPNTAALVSTRFFVSNECCRDASPGERCKPRDRAGVE